MDWHERIEEIQNRFFRCGLGTHLVIHVERVSLSRDDMACGLSGTYHVRWNFRFLDYGMCHAVSGAHLIETGVGTRGGRAYYIDKQYHMELDEQGACNAVFGGHYDKCVAELDSEMGVMA